MRPIVYLTLGLALFLLILQVGMLLAKAEQFEEAVTFVCK